MDNLTHSLVGLAAAKAGLDRLSPYSTTVCLLAANAPDIDSASGFFGDRWTVLQHHRGITHSILGTFLLALIVPALVFALAKLVSRRRTQPAPARFRGLLIASAISIVTHPLLDWTNNYGVRPLLPWSGKWFYGDLAFVVDPYIWLVLGGAVFLLTSKRWTQIGLWTVIGAISTPLVLLATLPRISEGAALGTLRRIWVGGVVVLIVIRVFRLHEPLGRSIVAGGLTLLVLYFGGLWWAHHTAYENALHEANLISLSHGEHLARIAAMPVLANPFRWQCVMETDKADYRFYVGTAEVSTNSGSSADPSGIERFEKPSSHGNQLISEAEKDRRVRIFLGFARFPIARVADEDCVGQSLVQFADLRYTEPGSTRGGFAVSVPVGCPAH